MELEHEMKKEKTLPAIEEIIKKLKSSKIPPTREEKIQEIICFLDKLDRRYKSYNDKKRLLELNYNVPILLLEITGLGTLFISTCSINGSCVKTIVGNNYELAELIYLRLEMKQSCPECGGLPVLYEKKNRIICPYCIGTGMNFRLTEF